MNILNSEQNKKVKVLFENYNSNKKMLEEIKQNIILSTKFPEVSVQNSDISDTVASSVLKIEKIASVLDIKVKIVEKTIGRFKGTVFEELINEKYIKNDKSIYTLCTEKFLSEGTVYNYFSKIYAFAYLIGVKYGLFDPE